MSCYVSVFTCFDQCAYIETAVVNEKKQEMYVSMMCQYLCIDKYAHLCQGCGGKNQLMDGIIMCLYVFIYVYR